MESSVVVERDCSALGGLFQIIINDMKGGTPAWEDLILKATKFHSQLKATIIASTAFLDAFQKIADMATSTRGGTKDIGTALTRLCLRQRSVEARLKTFTSSIMDCLILPLQDRLEDWKKITGQLDKDHSKEFKKLRTELKKGHFNSQNLLSHQANSLRFKKQAFRNIQIMSKSMDSMETSEKLVMFEEMEKRAVRRALTEERSRFCLLVNFFRPVIEEELHMLQEVTHLQEILDQLCKLTADPYSLPSSSELVISDLKLSSSETASWTLQTPPSSPSSFGSRKSSMCSISSFNSSSSGSTHSPSNHHCRYRSLSQPSVGPVFRHTSISSQDSGFMSQDYNLFHYAPPPLCSHYTNQFKNSEVSSLSEQSSGSTSSTSSIPPSNTSWQEAHLKTQKVTFDKNSPQLNDQSFQESQFSDEATLIAFNDSVTTEESLCLVINDNNNLSNCGKVNSSVCNDKPPVQLRDDKPMIPNKPDFSKFNQQGFVHLSNFDEQPIYANSSDLFHDDSNVAYSEGSITPTNPDRSSSPILDVNQPKNSYFGPSTSQRPNKPPPPPPPRTSNLSNPNVITIGTLKSVGVSTYEEIRNLGINSKGSIYEDLASISQNNNTQLKENTKPNNHCNNVNDVSLTPLQTTITNSNEFCTQLNVNEYKKAKNVFEVGSPFQHSGVNSEEMSSNTLPPPPPEAFSDTESSHGHSHSYNKITNVHRQFLENLNNKLAISPKQRTGPRVPKRRSMSLTQSDEDWNSDSAISNRTPSQTSIHQTLINFMTGSHSRASSASSARNRHQSPDTTRKKAAFTLASCDKESLMASLNLKLAQRQQSEVARAAAATALQRKQSVPDLMQQQQAVLNAYHNQYSSTTNLYNTYHPQQPTNQQLTNKQLHNQQIYQPAVQLQMRFQNKETCQAQPPQQPIYVPVLHQQQGQQQRKSSQPTMGVKITTSRQQLYDNSIDKDFHSTPKTSSGLLTMPQASPIYSNEQKEVHHQHSLIENSNNTSLNHSQCSTIQQDTFENAVAARVSSWFKSVQLPPELMLRRETLMDQIRRGKQLKRVSSNDRSLPKLTQ